MNPNMSRKEIFEYVSIFDYARSAANRAALLRKAYQSPHTLPHHIKALRQVKIAADDKVSEAVENAIRRGVLSLAQAKIAARLGYDSATPPPPRDYYANAEKPRKRKPHYKLSSKPIRAGRYVVITDHPRAGEIHKVTSVRLNSFSTVLITQEGKPEICCFPLPDTDGDRVVALPVQTKLWQEPTWHIM